MRNRIRATVATGIHFTRESRGTVIVNNTITPSDGGYTSSRA